MVRTPTAALAASRAVPKSPASTSQDQVNVLSTCQHKNLLGSGSACTSLTVRAWQWLQTGAGAPWDTGVGGVWVGGSRQQNPPQLTVLIAGSLSAFVYQHSITPLALPCKLSIPTRGRRGDTRDAPSSSRGVGTVLLWGGG